MGDPAIDWDAWTEQATEWLSDFIRVDTVNPPGHESRACEWLGRILDRMDDFNLWDSTMVMLITDHGHFLGEHGWWWKSTFYDGACRVPLLVAN